MEDIFRGEVDWSDVSRSLSGRGWSRLAGALDPSAAAALEAAAPGPWESLPGSEGSAGVRQAGRACHQAVEDSPDVVRRLAAAISDGIDSGAVDGIPPLPAFNHVAWCRPDDGRMFITPHRDPDGAGGVIAVVTLRGRAPFRVWDLDGPSREAQDHPDRAQQWDTGDGDVVLLRGSGWPDRTSRCPIHEAQLAQGERVALTLRHNTGGFGTDYFAES